MTINSLMEALTHGGRFRTLEQVSLLSPEPVMRGRLAEFEASVGGVECDLRVGEGVRTTEGWRLVERELTVFDEDGAAREMDVLIRPAGARKSETRKPDERYEEYAWDPVWGVATVMEEGRWWLLDGEGRTLNPAPFDWLGECSEGLIVALRDGRFGYIDTAGCEMTEFVYTDANSFADGRALVEQDGRSFYISR